MIAVEILDGALDAPVAFLFDVGIGFLLENRRRRVKRNGDQPTGDVRPPSDDDA
jgi:hypothetical protein